MKGKKTVIIALLLAFCMMLGACSSTKEPEKTAYQLVSEAVQKTAALDSCEMEMKIVTNTDALGSKMEIPMIFNLKMANAKSAAPTAIGSMKISMLGMDIKADVYFDSQYIYLSMMGMKYKMALNSAEASDYDFADTYKGVLQVIPEDILKDVKIVENEDKSKTVAFTVSGERFSEIYKELIKKMADDEQYSSMIEDYKSEIKVSDANVSITVLPSGYIGSYSVKFDMEIHMQSKSYEMDETVKMGLQIEINYVAPGTTVTVTPPSDLNEYMDATDMEDYDEDDGDFSGFSF